MPVFVYTDVCLYIDVWSIVVISHTPHGVRIGGDYYWPYSHSRGRANNLRLFALRSANKASQTGNSKFICTISVWKCSKTYRPR